MLGSYGGKVMVYKDRVMDKCNCVIGLIVGLYSRLGVWVDWIGYSRV